MDQTTTLSPPHRLVICIHFCDFSRLVIDDLGNSTKLISVVHMNGDGEGLENYEINTSLFVSILSLSYSYLICTRHSGLTPMLRRQHNNTSSCIILLLLFATVASTFFAKCEATNGPLRNERLIFLLLVFYKI